MATVVGFNGAPGTRKMSRRAARCEDIVRRLGDDIIHRRLAPGTRLDEHDIAKKAGSTRGPVREALELLIAAGLAEHIQYFGIAVASVVADRLRDMFIVMAELEAAAARLAAQRMSPAERRALEDLHAASREMVRQGSRDAYTAYNSEFHNLLYAGSHNRYLQDLLSTTRKHLSPFSRAQFNLLGRLAASHGEHDMVVQAILRGDGAAAAEAMRKHVMTVSAAAAEYLDAQTPKT